MVYISICYLIKSLIMDQLHRVVLSAGEEQSLTRLDFLLPAHHWQLVKYKENT